MANINTNIMAKEILTFYRELLEIKSFEGMPSNWELINPYLAYYDRFEFIIKKYYSDSNNRDLIIALNPGRFGCNKTGLALTDENILSNKLEYPYSIPNPATEKTATRIYSIIEDLYSTYNAFFAKFFMTNIFPFGIVNNSTNVNFKQLISIGSINEFSRNFIRRSISIFHPEKVICIGRGSEEFMKEHFPRFNVIYLRHPARTFQEKDKERYREYFK